MYIHFITQFYQQQALRILLGCFGFLLLSTSSFATCSFSIQGVAYTDAVCGGNDGTATVFVAGTTAPFTYLWSNGATTQTATGLSAGVYTVTITDATSCSSTAQVFVNNIGAASIAGTTVTAASCQNANGVLTLNITGNSPYNLAWAGAASGTQTGATATATIPNLRSGAYTLTITDANGCRNVSSFDITETGMITLITTNIQAPNCAGGNNGIVRVTATAGTLPFEFFLNGVSAGSVFSNVFDFANLTSGIYTVQVRDGSGCNSPTATVVLDESGATAITASSFSFTNATCAGVANGAVAEVTPSATPYQVFMRPVGTLVGALPQNALFEGDYEIRLNTGGCISHLPFTITNPADWDVEAQITNTNCLAGAADVNITDAGSATPGYTYLWSNGVTTQDLINVYPDLYSLTITDANACTFVWNNISVPNCSSNDTVYVLTSGTITYCVDTFDVQGNVGAVTNICPSSANNGTIAPIGINGCVTYTAGTVEGFDTVCVEVCNVGNTSCDTTTIIFIIDSPTEIVTTAVQTGQTVAPCPNITELPGTVISATNLACSPLDNGTINSINTSTACVSYTAGFVMGADTVCVRFCDNQGFCDTVQFVFNVQSPIDTIRTNVSATTQGTICPSLSAFTGAINSAVDLGCSVLNNGTIAGINSGNGCVRYDAGNVAGVDTICLQVCDVNGFCDTTIMIINVVPRPDTARIILLPGAAAVDTCPFNLQYPGTLSSVTNLNCDQNNVGTIVFDAVTGCVNYTQPTPSPGSGLRSDTVCVVLCDNSTPVSYCDTVVFIFDNPEPNCGGAVPLTITQQTNDCLSGVDVCLPIPFDSIGDYTISIDGTPYAGTATGCDLVTRVQYPVVLIAPCANDFLVTWVVNGVTLGPVQVTGLAGITAQLNAWDTTSTIWNLNANNTVIVGINNGNDNVTFGNLTVTCVTGGSPTVLGPTTQQQYAQGSTISFSGVGTFHLTVINQFGCVDTSLVRLFCVAPSHETDTVFLDSTHVNCEVDITQVQNVQTVTNLCPSTGNIGISIDTNTACLTISGLNLGVDSVCIVVCDSLGVCDTTYLVVDVILPRPIAVNDLDTVKYDITSINFNICDNDTFSLAQYAITILTPPTLGTLTGNSCNWTYTRNSNKVCGLDSFTYILSNNWGSDTATVYINIECKPFSISEGISPNGDGLNDKFVINSLTDFPNHKIYIFNRWGNQVFKAQNYQNDWQGTFGGSDLPDGIYFYIIELHNTRNEVFTGYLVIQR